MDYQSQREWNQMRQRVNSMILRIYLITLASVGVIGLVAWYLKEYFS